MDRYTILFLALIIWSCQYQHDQVTSPVVIDVWYGKEQTFGVPGLAQPWINILGNTTAENEIKSLRYSLNGNSPSLLTIGPDLHRLAGVGDFNIDIDRNSLRIGENEIIIYADDSMRNQLRDTIDLFYQSRKQWPLPYKVEWSKVDDLQQAVQVIDGKWEITAEGIHNVDTYYDRMFAIGDSTWKNYEVLTTVIFHHLVPPSKGPPTYNISHAGIAARWPGHDVDDLQPNRKWFPVGAFCYLRLTDEFDSCRWQMEDGNGFNTAQPISRYRIIQKEMRYKMKLRVEDISKTETRLSSKLWPDNTEEPDQWDLSAVKITNVKSGSALLVAHFTDVTFGDILATPIE